jgi:hypothetical protein
MMGQVRSALDPLVLTWSRVARQRGRRSVGGSPVPISPRALTPRPKVPREVASGSSPIVGKARKKRADAFRRREAAKRWGSL